MDEVVGEWSELSRCTVDANAITSFEAECSRFVDVEEANVLISDGATCSGDLCISSCVFVSNRSTITLGKKNGIKIVLFR